MSRCAPATAEELTATFEWLLASGGGDGIVSCTGLDSETWAAIRRAWDTPTPRAQAAARRAFALQLDGTHLREAEARMVARFADHGI